ncbi:uncharacterized protein K489DRAFT_432409 [Dissoconium aciculare CBS 342.82]|uniref:DNA damage-binding protein 1 n=1 Tax=Dissoconium aciculare CBS 342.82 TaxID=1314786 RepID=A0A6J3M095_9PEZI|nr:uncharacterized protein K489DRAFT_432409 [Dissoconium aciculare CBS 342.82]KAF1821431.1 hypothetical protein K489DRAFT_432409 [Dissoconium aciculare CBS 342.82]
MAYLAPIHRPSSVRHATRLSFLSADSDDLIVAKANRIELWTTEQRTPEEVPVLVLQHTRAIYGRVTLLQKIRPATSTTDHLFVGTDRYHYFTLSWDAEKKQLNTEKSYVDIAERTSRDSQTGDRINVDPSLRFMTLECYEGVINVIPIAHAGKGKRKAVATQDIGELGDPIPVRVPELAIRSSCFLHKRQAGTKLANPELAVLHEDSENQCRVKVRELEFSSSLRPSEEPSSAELEKCKEVNGQIELGASHLIALPPPIYGMLIVGETSISYVDEWEYNVKDEVPLDEATVFVAWCAIDDQRFALADDYGKLYLLMVETDSRGEYKGLKIDVLGKTSRASTLVYLDGGRIFVGSHQGDSQLISIQPQSLEILQTFANIAPILDFTVMDMGNRSSDAPVNEFSSGQARIVTGSGAFQDGSLRSVRSGVGLEDRGDLGSLDAPILGVFGLHSSAAATQVDTLVVSFVAHTRVFVFSEEGDVEEVEQYRGFNLAESTLIASDLPGGRSIQVTGSSVLLTDAEGGMVLDTWQAPASITAVSISNDAVLVSLQGATLILLDLSGSSVQERARREFGNNEQVSCISMSPSLSRTCVVGFWEGGKVAFLDLESLSTIAIEIVTEEGSVAVPRSLMVAKILADQPATLFVGLADGNVVTYSIESSNKLFASRKSIVLGTQQANFAVLPRADGLQNVFATCEHPSLIYGSEGRIVFSAVTAEDTTCVCSFDSFEPYGRAIAIASNDQLKLATVDEERTTHVQDLYIEETVRRIAYSAELKGFGLGCIKRELTAGVETVSSHFKFVDEIAFKELDSFDLNEDEIIEAVIRAPLEDGSGETAERFVVGTSYLEEPEADSMNGRVIVLEVTEDRRLKIVAERETKGACRCLDICQGHIVAALVKTVVMFSASHENSSVMRLDKICSYRTATAPIDISVTGNIIAVTDLMKSLSLIEYKPGIAGISGTLTEVARHFDTLWGTSVANVAENTYLQSDAEGNLVVLQHEVNGFNASDRRRLRVTSEMLLGEMVNRIRRIDVVPTAGAVVIPRAFLATVEGSIYLFALIAPGKQDLLIRMQTKMAEMVQTPGNVPFGRFRGVKTQVRDMGEEGPNRFVDGELIERFLDCPPEIQLEIAKELEVDVEDLKLMVENLRRIH